MSNVVIYLAMALSEFLFPRVWPMQVIAHQMHMQQKCEASRELLVWAVDLCADEAERQGWTTATLTVTCNADSEACYARCAGQ